MEICEKNKCTGCMACMNACPKGSISMQYDDTYELHPIISDGCVSCGKCRMVCPINNTDKNKQVSKICYAAYSLKDRDGTSSGGLATSISKYVLQYGGRVCGCVFDGTVHHIVANDIMAVDAMRGSKYVQSNIGYCYDEIKEIVKDHLCLFIGTPCQVAALRNIVGESENLICIDLICHGVPSPHFLNVVLQDFNEVNSISFRNKSDFSLKINGLTTARAEKYMTAFLHGMSFRESCYQCPFAENSRVGDLTIGDFWGIEHFTETGKGVSCVLVNTEKGKQIINAIRDELYVEERSFEEAYRENPQLKQPSKKHKNRSRFINYLLSGKKFEYSVAKTMKKEIIKNWIKKRYIVKTLLELKSRRR